MSKYPHVREWINRQGNAVIQFRPPHALKALGVASKVLPGPIGSSAFTAAYAAAMAAIPAAEKIRREPAGSIGELIKSYLLSRAFFLDKYAPETQYRRRVYLQKFAAACGERPAATMPAAKMAELIARNESPFARKDYLKAVRGFWKYAIDQGVRPDDPSAGIKVPKVKTDGFATWTDDEVDQYRAAHHFGSLARLTFELAYEGALRRGDVCLIGPAHVREIAGVKRLEFYQKKTGGFVSIPLDRNNPLMRAIVAYRLAPGAATFLQTEYGATRSYKALSTKFREWRELAGLQDGLSLHGLRKAQARLGAEVGGTDHELMAHGGWKNIAEVQTYTAEANRRLMADNLAAKKRAALAGRSARVVGFPKRARG